QCSHHCAGVAASLIPYPWLRASRRWVMCLKDITPSPMAQDRAVNPRRYDVTADMHSWVVFQKWRWPCLHRPSKGIAVDKQANHNVMHLRSFREADRLAD